MSLVSVAEHVLMLTLMLTRRALESDRAVREGQIHPVPRPGEDGSVYNWAGIEGITPIYGKTLGIIGLGEIGLLVAERARALGMRLLHHDLTPSASCAHSEWRPLDRLLAESDVVTVHVPGKPGDPLVDEQFLTSMRPGSLLVNTSRGYLVDEDALYRALMSGHLAGAALDDHAREPRASDRFTKLESVVLTPHVASGSRRAVLSEGAAIFANIRSILDGAPPAHALVAAHG
jgi:phosphoglycerate dehydrogenase-like enzyme